MKPQLGYKCQPTIVVLKVAMAVSDDHLIEPKHLSGEVKWAIHDANKAPQSMPAIVPLRVANGGQR
jgi:hypothetical protein